MPQLNKNLIPLLRALAELGSKEKHSAWTIHEHAKLYRKLLCTEDRLRQLEKCGLLRIYDGAKYQERYYRITGDGTKFLRKSPDEQKDLLRTYLWRITIPKECVVCKRQDGITWFKGLPYCPKHLNSKYEKPPLQSYVVSPLGWD